MNYSVSKRSLVACNLTGDAADSVHASAQLVASASGMVHSVDRATVQLEPSGAFIPENSSVPREVGLLRAGRGTSHS